MKFWVAVLANCFFKITAKSACSYSAVIGLSYYKAPCMHTFVDVIQSFTLFLFCLWPLSYKSSDSVSHNSIWSSLLSTWNTSWIQLFMLAFVKRCSVIISATSVPMVVRSSVSSWNMFVKYLRTCYPPHAIHYRIRVRRFMISYLKKQINDGDFPFSL